MIGYGLEPYISKENTTALLELARPHLEANQPAEAIHLLIQKLSLLFDNASRNAWAILGRSDKHQ